MKAAVCREYNSPLTIEEIQIAPPDPDQIEVTMKAVAAYRQFTVTKPQA